MKKWLMVALVLVTLSAVGSAAVVPRFLTAGDIVVTVTYTGKGKVDDTHEILVFLFDQPTPTADSDASRDADHDEERWHGDLQGRIDRSRLRRDGVRRARRTTAAGAAAARSADWLVSEGWQADSGDARVRTRRSRCRSTTASAGSSAPGPGFR